MIFANSFPDMTLYFISKSSCAVAAPIQAQSRTTEANRFLQPDISNYPQFFQDQRRDDFFISPSPLRPV